MQDKSLGVGVFLWVGFFFVGLLWGFYFVVVLY